jgi:predicted ATPase
MYISSFAISGYRSLKNVTISGMRRVCIFHGLNNSGKSNILSAMATIFSRKTLVEETTVAEVTKHERQGSFWQGRISQFKDNFYCNEKEDITFSVSVTFRNEELAFLNPVLQDLHPSLARPGHDKVLTLSGRIKYVDDDTADMVLEKAVFNRIHVVFEVDGAGKKSFFPKLGKLTAEQRLAHFEDLMNLLPDSFALLASDRYLVSEVAIEGSKETLSFSPKNFKNWLFRLSLSRSGHAQFEEIKGMFKGGPFSVGEIGFSKERDEIEIMVQEPRVRLPISRLGSGHQQILFIIASLVLNRGKMLGIEELEVNLSPKMQKILFEKLKSHIYQTTDLVSQILITSHSDYFSGRRDVRCYGVEHDGTHTVVRPWTQATKASFFSRS